MRARSLPLVLLLAGGTALAIRPPEGVPSGREPVRVRVSHAPMQAHLATADAWQAFTAGEGAGWEARFDEVTGAPHRLWGKGLPLGPLPDADAVGRASLDWVGAHPDLLHLGRAVPELRTAGHVASRDAWYVDVDTVIDGLPVWRGGVTLRIAHDRLVMVGADTYGDARVVNDGVLGPDAAIAAWLASGPVPWITHTDAAVGREVLLPEVRGKVAVLRRVWEVSSRTEDPVGRWSGLVDSETGEVVASWNEVRFVDGQLSITHDDRLGRGDLLVSPLANGTVQGETHAVRVGTTTTDADGRWSMPDADVYSVRLDGPLVRVLDDLDGSLAPRIDVPDDTIDDDDLVGGLAAASTFVFVQQVRDFARTFGPDVSWIDERAVAHVNIDDTCNAYWDGSLHFYQAGHGCRNTGRLADVVYHEWGHGFHYYSIEAGTYDGSLGEGAADVMAFLLTEDHELAPGFFEADNGPLRDALNRLRWPDDYADGEDYIHDNGMLFSGAMWDTWQELKDELGEPAAKQQVEAIYAGLLKGGPDLETAYDEAIFADDDDADLSNGTPHQCALVNGFGDHGLGPRGGFGYAPRLKAPIVAVPGVDVAITLELPNPAGGCFTVTPADGTVWWSLDGDTWQQAPLHVSDGELTGAIPGSTLALGDVVQWYATIDTSRGDTIVAPVGGRIRPHTVYVGDVLELSCFDFEHDDGGFSHRLIDGEDEEGADDWKWGRPQGTGGDPLVAASGAKVWGNDLGGDNYDGQYQPEKHNALFSPKLHTGHYLGAFLRYARWLRIEDGYYDQAFIEADGEAVWQNWATDEATGTDHHLDDAWETHVVDLGGHGDDGSVRLAWHLRSDQGLSFGGWTIDDVCLFAPDTPDNRLGIDDFTASRTDGLVTLAWTMPHHDPVTAVRVVRARGWWPSGADDGDVVWEGGDVTLDAPATITDTTSEDDLYYAVYASDGEHWLSWTREGFNAASVDATPEGDPTTVDPAAAGCGCNGASSSPAAGLAGLAWLLARRRRR